MDLRSRAASRSARPCAAAQQRHARAPAAAATFRGAAFPCSKWHTVYSLQPSRTPAARKPASSLTTCRAAAATAAADDPTPTSPDPLPLPARKPRPLLKTLAKFPSTWVLILSYITLMLVVPIAALLTKAAAIPPEVFLARATEPIALHCYYVTFSLAAFAALINAVLGFVLAWVLVRYQFPGKKWMDAAVDLPFALPTSVAGLTLVTVYGEEGVMGALLAQLGINVVFTRLGVAIAMIFVSFPFVVRTMQPVLQEMEREQVEAAWSLGASPWRTFVEVIFPPLVPALLTGTALAFSRAIGEFGSIVIISSNFAFKDLVAPVLIFQCLEQYDFVGATVVGTVMLLTSLAIMLCVNWLQSQSQKYRK